MISLLANDLIELIKAMLQCLKNMCLELSKAVLHLNHILSVGILFLDLLIQTMVDSSLDNIGIVMSSNFAACRIETCCVLSEQFNVLLRSAARLVHSFPTLSSTLDQFLVLGLDFSV